MGTDIIEILYGDLKTKITLPKLTTEIQLKKFLWFRWSIKVYYIDYEFCRVGPYKSRREASEIYRYALRAYR